MSDPSNMRQGHQYGAYPAQHRQYQPGTDPSQQLQPYGPAPKPAFAHHPAAVATRQPLVSPGGRFGAFLLDVLLAMVTLWIGWFVWSMVTWSRGQSPGKQLLGHVVVDPVTGHPFDWGRMALRQFVIGGLLGTVLNTISFSIYFWVDSLMVLGDGRRTLHDRMANSIVVHQATNG